MKTEGNGFKYFVDGKEVLYKDLQTMIRLGMTVDINGLNVYYSSPEEKDKPERSTYSKLEDVTISPKKVKDRLILAEKFKKKALDEIYFKNPNFKKEQEDNKFSKLNHNEVREEFINRARTEKMNRLIEEELERQEEDDSKSTGDYLEIMMYDWINNLTGESKPSGILGVEDAAKIMAKGKKENNGKPQISLLFKQFPKALEAIARCSEYGHLKYESTDADYLNYQRVEEGSKAYADAGLRHRMYKRGTTDIESQLPHAYHVAWNALAELELLIKENLVVSK